MMSAVAVCEEGRRRWEGEVKSRECVGLGLGLRALCLYMCRWVDNGSVEFIPIESASIRLEVG